jgi:sucrose-6-phosphate hydrolase SacC (GH32 family)
MAVAAANDFTIEIYTRVRDLLDLESRRVEGVDGDDAVGRVREEARRVVRVRDPKVFWYEDHWVMAVAAANDFTIEIYTSPNLTLKL